MNMSNYGIFDPKPYYSSEVGKKVLKVFEKLKRKANKLDRIRRDPRLGEQDEGPNFEQLNRDAVKSLHILPQVVRTDEGYQLAGDNGLDPDYYSPDG